MISFRVDVLAEDDWPRLRDIRLKALNIDPTAFLASHETEAAFAERQWRQEFTRGEWHVMRAAGQGPGRRDVGLLGATRLPGMPMQECYLEYMWVAPGFRRRRMASIVLRTVLHRLRNSGMRTVWLYILDGNDGAMQLYKRFGFQRTNERQELPGHPASSEEKMQLRLT